MLVHPGGEKLPLPFRIIKGQMLPARKVRLTCQRLRDKPIRAPARLAVKRFVQGLVEQDRPKAHHGELSRNRPICFDIDNYEGHTLGNTITLRFYTTLSATYPCF